MPGDTDLLHPDSVPAPAWPAGREQCPSTVALSRKSHTPEVRGGSGQGGVCGRPLSPPKAALCSPSAPPCPGSCWLARILTGSPAGVSGIREPSQRKATCFDKLPEQPQLTFCQAPPCAFHVLPEPAVGQVSPRQGAPSPGLSTPPGVCEALCPSPQTIKLSQSDQHVGNVTQQGAQTHALTSPTAQEKNNVTGLLQTTV